ncbi:adenylate/guanylate cyclase domain-containing protein [Burkholderia pseudomultivorans]|uniref:adenylate/guanylate cyclase domain-containing protein n=1 Tax=Burkholderia pseudomultivorans TaxID=1207504 RepID=UPI0018C53782|nr:adenylate/guanylate cyclase domain-containing protein [Burkholderia pseudomultivorans]
MDDLLIGSGRRLAATVLFLDVCKFSQRPAESMEEQELLLRILSFFFTEMVRVVEDYQGVVEKNTGDGLMAYFTAQPDTDVDVRQRAVEAALTMFYAADHFLNPVIRSTPADPIDFRICMDHGWITVARIGAAQRFNSIVAVGSTANVASKMLAAAGPNSILLGERMLLGLPDAWREAWVTLKTSDTGWSYRASGQPYSFWEYNGRWRKPE